MNEPTSADHYFTAEPASAAERRQLRVFLAGREHIVETAPGVFWLALLAPGGLFEFVFMPIWLIAKGFGSPQVRASRSLSLRKGRVTAGSSFGRSR